MCTHRIKNKFILLESNCNKMLLLWFILFVYFVLCFSKKTAPIYYFKVSVSQKSGHSKAENAAVVI